MKEIKLDILTDEEIKKVLLKVADRYYDAEIDVTVSQTVLAKAQVEACEKQANIQCFEKMIGELKYILTIHESLDNSREGDIEFRNMIMRLYRDSRQTLKDKLKKEN